ncbi:stage III sporulation protein AF [Salibacterium aidingense]|uniref:stage III sporulation protein AF n=1 Tax=Salibacterium aidingense TaxID=384933 RepID=UPI00041516C3|nr:stage III sporulation protein AF [Salibacterium aidingense]
MEAFSEWMSNLIIFLLAAFLLELLLPSSSFQKYARLVLSFILMLLIIEPLLSITSSNPEQKIQQTIENWRRESFEDQSIELEMNKQKNEIEAGQDAYISKQVSSQLKDQADRHVKDQWGWEVEDISIESLEEDLNTEDISVFVTLRKAENEEEKDEDEKNIEPVRINVEHTSEETVEETSEETSGEAEEIHSYLAETWDLRMNQIHISLVEEGG